MAKICCIENFKLSIIVAVNDILRELEMESGNVVFLKPNCVALFESTLFSIVIVCISDCYNYR